MFFSECLAKNKIPDSWLMARMIVILKLDKNLVNPQDYRPISLLYYDYKIKMTTLASRLNGILGAYRKLDQDGFIQSQFMRDRIRQVINVVDWVRERKILSLLYFLDAKKAFDRLEWSFLKELLRRKNFGPVFLQWVNLLYDKQLSCWKG